MAIQVWYYVSDLEVGLLFYTATLGFKEVYRDTDEGWARMNRGEMEIGLSEGERIDAGVAIVDVSDIKAEAERLRAAGVEIGTILELHNEVRLLDVFDPDGNRIQLAQTLS